MYPNSLDDTLRAVAFTLVSLVVHLLAAVIAAFYIERNAANTLEPMQVFTVTLEGGVKLGGVTQVPDKNAKNDPPKDLNNLQPKVDKSNPETTPETTPAEEKEPEIESPTAVAERERLQQLEEEKKRLAEIEQKKKKEKELKEKEKKEEEKKKLEQEKLDKKKRDEEERREQILKEKRERETNRKQLDARLNAIRKNVGPEHEGESANAGGEGIGAAKLGGKGFGGGTLISAEKLAYLQALENHVKRGWNWIGGPQKLEAYIRFRISPQGEVLSVNVERGSGNANFDDSAVRAVRRASPVPVPPTNIYAEVQDVRVIFDSERE